MSDAVDLRRLGDELEGYYSASYPPEIITPGPPPVIATLTPSSVSLAAMPATVTITGTGFAPGMSVLVDGVAYPSGVYVSPTSATFAPAASAAGTQQITVRVAGQTSNARPLTVTAVAGDEAEAGE